MNVLPVEGERRMRGAGVATRLWLDNAGLMVLEVKGLVTPEIGALIVQQLQEGVQTLRPNAILADYRGACMAADPRTMVDVIDRGMFRRYDRKTRLMTPPAAALVSAGALDLWKQYAALMALNLGLVRGAFAEGEAAWDWLSRQARALAI